jgi:hypothetical protein
LPGDLILVSPQYILTPALFEILIEIERTYSIAYEE